MLACTHPAFDGPVILFQDVIKFRPPDSSLGALGVGEEMR